MTFKQELQRKAFHLLGTSVPVTYIFVSKITILNILIPVTILSIIIDLSRLYFEPVKKLFYKIFGVIVRPHEEHNLTATTYFLTANLLAVAFFPKNIVIMSLLFLTISDSAAAIFGRKFGKHKIFDKSLEGSAAFFVTALIIGIFTPEISTVKAVAASAFATAIELLPLRLDDNFRIPVATCLFMQLINIVF